MGYSSKPNRFKSESSGKRITIPVRIIVAGLIASSIIIVMWYWFSLDTTKVESGISSTKVQKERSAPRSLVTNVSASVTSTSLKPQEELSDAWKMYYDGRDTNKWIVVKDPKTGKEYLSRLMKPGMKNRKPPLYKARALNVLNAILFKDPGTPLPGIKIDDRFAKSFQDALLEKIEIADSDSEEDKQLKLAMIETMDLLKQEIKNGGDIKKIVGDALAERQRISTMKQMMIQERVNMKNSGASEDEIAEFEKECNRRLAEKGATPLLTRQLLLERIKQKKSVKK